MAPAVLIPVEAEFRRNYQQAVEAAGGRAVCSTDLKCADACDALLLPGGGDVEPWRYGQENTASCGFEPQRDALELEALARFTAAEKPVLGICRGMQLINVGFGGTLIQDLPGHTRVDGIDRLHTVHTAPSFLRDVYGPTAIVNSAHHQAVDRLGAGLRAVQWTADGTVEALCHEQLPVWAVQWHPERLHAGFATAGTAEGLRLFRAFLENCRA